LAPAPRNDTDLGEPEGNSMSRELQETRTGNEIRTHLHQVFYLLFGCDALALELELELLFLELELILTLLFLELELFFSSIARRSRRCSRLAINL
jgi:hypothetical protein